MIDLPNKYSKEMIDDFIKKNENPVIISFYSPKKKETIITVPVWTFYFNQKFYIFTGEKSLKVKAIKLGLNNFSIIIVDKNSFPDVYSSNVPYLSASGKAKIVTFEDDAKVSNIYIKILEKYNYEGAPGWINELLIKTKNKPEESWLIEITPEKYYVFTE